MIPWLQRGTLALASVILTLSLSTASAEPFDLADGERVVLIGGTFAERAQQHDYIEAALTARFPGRKLVFRNLGWSGDTVWGESRAGFDTRVEGYRRLVEHVRELAPTVVLVAYGANESFSGPEGIPDFVAGLDRLLNDLRDTGARFVLLAPTRQEHLGAPLPDPAAHNRDLRLYGRMLEVVAAQRGYRYVDLFSLIPDGNTEQPPCPLTDNGLHYAGYGYWRAADALLQGLELTPGAWSLDIDADGEEFIANGATATEVARSPGAVQFTLADATLPASMLPDEARTCGLPATTSRTIRVRDLAAGNHTLKIDGTAIATKSAAEWAAGVTLESGPELAQSEELRRAIVAKNELYFYRWRPQNETYLFGFRKYEQGQNAQEVPKFDPLVAEAEAKIFELAQPKPHRYELVAESEVSE